MNTKRLKFTIIIGSDALSEKRLNAMIGMFNHFYGGLTYSQKTGTWNENASESDKWYHGTAVTELAHYFEIVTDNLSVDNNMAVIKNIVSRQAKNAANWIHVECTEILALHFSIEEYAANGGLEIRLTDDSMMVTT